MVIAAFFRDESCGQCVPCRVGTVRQQEALARLLSGHTRGSVQDELALIAEIGAGDARRLDLRPGPDRLVGDRVRDRRAGSVRMTRAHGQPHDRRPAGRGPRGLDDPQACAQLGIDTPTLCYGETLQPANAAASAWSSSRARACWRRPARARSSRTWSSRPTPSACATAARWSWSSSRRRPTSRRRRPPQDYLERYDARPRALRAAGAAGPRPRPPAHRPPRGARRPDRRHRARADQGRQRPLRARLLEVHPLLQVRRRLRRAVAEHVRHHRRRARVRRPHLDRVRQPAARLGVRVLRQLHRRLPDRRADVRLRARAARGRRSGTSRARRRRTRSAPTAASAATSRCTCRTTRSSRSPRPTITTSPAATCASRAASASSTSRRRPPTRASSPR